MAEENINNRYARTIYVNGVPYKIRDEESRAEIAKLQFAENGLSQKIDGINDILNANFINREYRGGIIWNEEHRKDSRIPYFEVNNNAPEEGNAALSVRLY